MVEPKDDYVPLLSQEDTNRILHYDNFEDRQGFLKKVYGIISGQMTITTAFIVYV